MLIADSIFTGDAIHIMYTKAVQHFPLLCLRYMTSTAYALR